MYWHIAVNVQVSVLPKETGRLDNWHFISLVVGVHSRFNSQLSATYLPTFRNYCLKIRYKQDYGIYSCLLKFSIGIHCPRSSTRAQSRLRLMAVKMTRGSAPTHAVLPQRTQFCHNARSSSLDSHRGRPGYISGQSIWDLWRIMWHWDRFIFKFFSFLQLLSSLRRSDIQWRTAWEDGQWDCLRP
jgi:hypothetical protein